MKVQFVCDCEIEVISNFDEALDDGDSETEVFRAGEFAEFDVVDHPQRMVDGELRDDLTMVNVQFGDGSVAFGLSCEWFKEIQ